MEKLAQEKSRIRNLIYFMSIVHFAVAIVLLFAIEDVKIRMSLFSPFLLFLPALFLLRRNKLLISNILIGCCYPIIAFLSIQAHKLSVGIDVIDPVHLYSHGLYLFSLMLIPWNLFRVNERIFAINYVLIIVLLISNQLITILLRYVAGVELGNSESPFVFDIMLIITTVLFSYFLWYSKKTIGLVKDRNQSLLADNQRFEYYKRVTELDYISIDPNVKIEAIVRMMAEIFDTDLTCVHFTDPQYQDYETLKSENQKFGIHRIIKNEICQVISDDVFVFSDRRSSHRAKLLLDKSDLFLGHTIYVDQRDVGSVFLNVETSDIVLNNELVHLFQFLSLSIQKEVGKIQNERDKVQKEQLALIAEKSTNAVIITDPAGKITWVNQGFSELFGYHLSDAVGVKPGDLLRGPASYKEGQISELVHAMREKRPCNVKLLNYSKLGEKVWVDFRLVPIFDEENNLKQFIAIETDITELKNLSDELKKKTQQLELALSSEGLLFFEFDWERKKLSFTPKEAERKLLGRHSKIKTLKDFVDHIHPHHRHHFMGLLRENRDHMSCEIEFINTDSQEFSFGLSMQKVKINDTSSRPIYSGIIQDISPQKKAENNLLLGQELERSRIGREIHDGIGQMLVGTRLTFSEYVNSKTDHLLKDVDTLIHSIITESRMIINNLSVNYIESNSITESIDNLVIQMRKATQAKIICDVVGEQYFIIPSIGVEIFRISQEALSNAIKYSNASLIRIQIYFNETEFKLVVVDNGEGFVESNIDEGFGIKNMRERSSKIGGQLGVKSETRVGTQVQFSVDRFKIILKST